MIRKITKSDKDTYIALATEFYNSDAVYAPIPKEYIERTFNEAMNSDRYIEICMLETEGAVVGYGLLAKTFQQEAGGTTVWIDEIYVRPAYRSHGLGKEFFKYVDTLGASRLRLEIEPDNIRACKLYENLGFTPLPYNQMIKQSD